jgi:hypothetical protein
MEVDGEPAAGQGEPSQTLYVHNLAERVRKEGTVLGWKRGLASQRVCTPGSPPIKQPCECLPLSALG